MRNKSVTMEKITRDQMEKLETLKDYVKDLHSVAVAFSGGVDSTFLLKVASEVLGDHVIAVTARSRSFPQRELDEAMSFCGKEEIRHCVFDSEELSVEGFAQNPPNRCYLCKKELFQKIRGIAKENGMQHVIEGSNLDDDGDYRPGLLAVAELGIKSPLRECGLTKADIRELSSYLGLPTWEKPSFACLASRFVYGETITEEKLHMVDQAEQRLLDLGFRQIRVRIHDRMARIEIDPKEFETLIKDDIRTRIIEDFTSYGFTYITMDLMGYRTGSMNETLDL